MKIIACVKVVPDIEDITATPDGKLSFDRAAAVINSFDLNAIEEGARLAGEDGELVTLSVGDEATAGSKVKKDILSRGPQEAFFVADEAAAGLDTYQTASVLKAAAEKIGDFDLILCGDGSADVYAQQVGIQLAELMNLPVINSVSKIEPGEGVVEIERTVEDGVEILEVQLPAVLCVTSDINVPRIAGMRELLSSGKKPSTVWSIADLGPAPSATLVETHLSAPPKTERKNIIFQSDSDEAINDFIAALRAELK